MKRNQRAHYTRPERKLRDPTIMALIFNPGVIANASLSLTKGFTILPKNLSLNTFC